MEISLKDLKSLMSCGEVSKPSEPDRICHGKEIVVMPSGWVVQGTVYQDGDQFEIVDANVVHYWGTTQGLGELAANGPLEKTKLYPVKNGIKFHQLTYVMRMQCSKKW